MLKSLKITGFKTIVDAKLEFGRVNLFIGANGAGKSNILEAIGVLAAALGRDITDTELLRKGVRLSVPVLFKSSFRDRKLAARFGLEAMMDQEVGYHAQITASSRSQTLHFFSEQIDHQNQTCLGRSERGMTLQGHIETLKDNDPERGLWDRFREVVDVPQEVTAELNQLSQFCIYAPQTSFLRGVEVETLPVKPVGLMGGGLPQAAMVVLRRYNSLKKKEAEIRKLMDEVFDLIQMPGWIEFFAVGEHNPSYVSSQVKTGKTLYFGDRFMEERRNQLSAYDSSEGSLYLLFLAIIVLHLEAPKIFALDNVDNALNPATTRLLLEKLLAVTCEERFRKHGIGPEQIFLTSHNPTALDAFDLFNTEHRVFVVHRDPKSGFTNVDPLRPSPGITRADWIRAASGKNLSEMWISGLIPNALGIRHERMPDL